MPAIGQPAGREEDDQALHQDRQRVGQWQQGMLRNPAAEQPAGSQNDSEIGEVETTRQDAPALVTGRTGRRRDHFAGEDEREQGGREQIDQHAGYCVGGCARGQVSISPRLDPNPPPLYRRAGNLAIPQLHQSLPRRW